MSDKKISQLSSSGTITGAEEVPVVQSGTTVKATINAIKTFFDSIYTTTSAVASQISTALSGYVNTSGLTANYIPKASDSDTLGNSQIRDNGTSVGIAKNPINAARLEIDGSTTLQGVYVTTSGNIGVNVVETSGIANKSEVTTGTAFRANLTNLSAVGIDIEYTPTGSKRLQQLASGHMGVNVLAQATTMFLTKGSDSTSSNNAAVFVNSSDSEILKLRNDRAIIIDSLTANRILELDANKVVISAAKNSGYNLALGTTAGTVLEGNALANIKDTFMLQSGSAGLSPADATTYYLGISGIAPNTTATNFAFKIGYDFRIVGCIILSGNAGTAGTTENSTINFRNITTATSTLISNSVKTNSTSTSQINQTVNGLNITGAANDDVCFEWITPTWVTNPTNCTFLFRVYIEKLS